MDRPEPPVPPRPELIPGPGRAAAPATPMMDFFQRRLESLEKELALERERAASAQALLRQQDALKEEVDGHLKALTDQLRREKNERETDEERSHARGRVQALERRLDEMNATFAQLLKDAVARQAAPAPQAPALDSLGAELAVFRRTIKDVADQVARWRDEMKELPLLVPELRSVAARAPEEARSFETSAMSRLEDLSIQVKGALADWERRHALERTKLEEKLQALADERTAMARVWEQQGHAARQESLKERIARETAVSEQVAELSRRLDELSRAQQDAAAGSERSRDALERVLRAVTTPPKAKDQLLAELEGEKAALSEALARRQEELRRFAAERRDVERSLGDSLVGLTAELERERSKTRAADARAAELRGELERAAARAAELERSIAERDERLLSTSAERDQLARALVSESEKARRALEEKAAADDRWHERMLERQRAAEEESARALGEQSSLADARAKIAALSDHLARALAERDGVVARFADWERERQRLLDALKQKDGMISMLSGAFQGALKK